MSDKPEIDQDEIDWMNAPMGPSGTDSRGIRIADLEAQIGRLQAYIDALAGEIYSLTGADHPGDAEYIKRITEPLSRVGIQGDDLEPIVK